MIAHAHQTDFARLHTAWLHAKASVDAITSDTSDDEESFLMGTAKELCEQVFATPAPNLDAFIAKLEIFRDQIAYEYEIGQSTAELLVTMNELIRADLKRLCLPQIEARVAFS